MLRSIAGLSLCSALTLAAALPALAADAPKKRDITLDDLVRIQRVGAPVVSPEGDWVAYTVSQIDTKEDKGQSHRQGRRVCAALQPRRQVHQLSVVAARTGQGLAGLGS
jgi:hypothetical protein